MHNNEQLPNENTAQQTWKGNDTPMSKSKTSEC